MTRFGEHDALEKLKYIIKHNKIVRKTAQIFNCANTKTISKLAKIDLCSNVAHILIIDNFFLNINDYDRMHDAVLQLFK